MVPVKTAYSLMWGFFLKKNYILQYKKATFNIQLGLLSVIALPVCYSSSNTTFPFNKQCDDSYTISNRLSDFAHWRGTQTDPKTGGDAGLYHLLSGSCAK